ncbi:MAG: SLC13 family permease [Candidatus Eisenbacteria sp.]|nr:SLC13 family permease [Candidatus Eisenbacteria bacterium]
MEPVLLTGIILITLVLFITRLLPIALTSIFIIAALALTGILEPHEALQGFSSTATITVAAMLILSAGLMRTGALEFLRRSLSNYCELGLPRLLLAFALVVALSSAFMNNTPVVVIMIPVIMTACRRTRLQASKLLIPVSYFSILGGTCTLIGTGTNLLIDDLFRRAGGPGFNVFDFTSVGLVYLVVGAAVVILLAPRLLPERASLSVFLTQQRDATFVTEVVLQPDSPLIGRNVGEVFSGGGSVQLRELIRNEELFMATRAENLTLESDDALIVEGSPQEIARFLASFSGIELASVVEDEQRVPMKTLQLRLVEAVVLPDSRFIGRAVRDLGLNRLYGVKVMAVQRRGRAHRYQIRAMRLQPGDVLLLQSDDNGFAALRETGAVLVVEGVEQTVHRRQRMPIAVAIMAAVVISASVFGLPLVISALVGVGLMLGTRCLRLDEALQSLDLTTLMLLAGTIPLGVAMLKTGLAEQIVSVLLHWIDPSHPWMLISTLYLMTAVLTAFLSNHAAAVLLTPIAFRLAADLGIDPHPLMIAVAFGASASFATPIGYQTNMIVMGPGGYTFSDYLRVGLPLTIVLWITATLVIPIFWPL